MNSHLPGHLMDDKRGKNIQWEMTISSINDIGKTGQVHAKESNLITLSHHAQK